jgi:cytochrome c oxidase assembly protein subunit 15
LRAGLIYNTWPLIDGAIVPKPGSLFLEQPVWRNLFENMLTVQFNHRMMAYAIVVIALLHLADALRTRSQVVIIGAAALTAVVLLQAVLGIVTLLYQAPLALALAHQGMAMLVLTVALLHAERVMRRQAVPALTPMA